MWSMKTDSCRHEQFNMFDRVNVMNIIYYMLYRIVIFTINAMKTLLEI